MQVRCLALDGRRKKWMGGGMKKEHTLPTHLFTIVIL